MGGLLTHQFMVEYSPSLKLDKLNKSTCDLSLQATTDHVKNTIELIKNMDVTDMTQTDDFKEYGLLPGQLIKRTSHIGIPHTAVYYWDGIIIEMGSGPIKCEGNIGTFTKIRNNIIGLAPLDQFITLAKTAKSSNASSSKEEALKRLNRALEVMGKCSYWYLTNNCFHSMNYIAHGRKSLTHIKNLYTKPIKVVEKGIKAGFGKSRSRNCKKSRKGKKSRNCKKSRKG